MCYLHVCSQCYIVVHVELVDFLSSGNNSNNNDASLQHTYNKFLAIQPVRCHVRCSENLLHQSTLWFTAAVASGFCAIVATCVLASITSLNYVGRLSYMPTCN